METSKDREQMVTMISNGQFGKAVGDYKQDILDVFAKAIKETFKQFENMFEISCNISILYMSNK